ncbi:MAG TPA: MT-A70 family methyltransferase [Tardiphaga sp.]
MAPTNAHFRSRFEAPVGAHSEKPDEQYEHAEYHFPNLPKIELNARRGRPGWSSWGFEAPGGLHVRRSARSFPANRHALRAVLGSELSGVGWYLPLTQAPVA